MHAKQLSRKSSSYCVPLPFRATTIPRAPSARNRVMSIRRLATRLRNSQIPQHPFSVQETTAIEIVLRGGDCPMESRAVLGVEPVARIERQEIDFSAFGHFRRLVHHEPTILNSRLQSHS